MNIWSFLIVLAGGILATLYNVFAVDFLSNALRKHIAKTYLLLRALTYLGAGTLGYFLADSSVGAFGDKAGVLSGNIAALTAELGLLASALKSRRVSGSLMAPPREGD